MARFKDVNWNLAQAPGGAPATWEQVQLALLMDIRDELRRLNGLLHCPNFTGIPHTCRARVIRSSWTWWMRFVPSRHHRSEPMVIENYMDPAAPLYLPDDVRSDLMKCAASNGRISLEYLVAIYRCGVAHGKGKRPPVTDTPQRMDDSRCAVCGWPLDPTGAMCLRGSCSQRPLPKVAADPVRAVAEYKAVGHRVEFSETLARWCEQASAAPTVPPQEGR